jgi:hypothetical protein
MFSLAAGIIVVDAVDPWQLPMLVPKEVDLTALPE